MATTTEQTSEQATSSAGAGRTDDGSADTRPEWAEDLKDEILNAVKGMLGTARGRERQHLTEPGQSRAERGERDLDSMIAEAIRVNEQAKAAEQRDRQTGERLDALEQARPETQPVERGRLHRAMKWGEPAA